MNSVVFDTVGLLAVWDEVDQWHVPAEAVFRTLVRLRARVVTTTLVVHECGNAAARKPFRREMLAYGGLISPMETDEIEAWDNYRRGLAGDAGSVDQVSFAVMRRLGILQAFTNDKHFAAAGFQVLS